MEMLVFIGCQGAGKTSYFLRHYFATHLRINLDQLRTRHRERLLLEACIAMKQRCVIDNTNPRIADRARYLEAAQRGRFRTIACWFDVAVERALPRNQSRAAAAVVPERAVIATARRIEAPTRAEGFDEIRRVRLRDDGDFAQWELLDEVR